MDDTETSRVGQDRKDIRDSIFKDFGWYFLIEEIAKYTNTTFFDILNKPAIELAGIVTIMNYKSLYLQYK